MEIDYSGQNLRGRSFKGQNLQGKDFSNADIRGANFAGADLTNADFQGVKTGLQRRWWLFLLMVCLFSAFLSGAVLAAVGAAPVHYILSSDIFAVWGGAISLILYLIYVIVTSQNGIIPGLYFLLGALAVAVVVSVAFSAAGVGSEAVAGVGAVAVAVAVAVAGAVVGGGVGAGAFVFFHGFISWRALRGNPRDAFLRRFGVAIASFGGTSFREATLF